MSYKVIRGGRVLDIQNHQATPADVLIEGNRIIDIMAPDGQAPGAAETINAKDHMLIPGLVNAHTHSHGGLAKGFGDRWSLELLLHASRWISGHRTAEHLYLSALASALEMVRKGCTSCYDLYLELPLPSIEGLEALGRAYMDVGMRAVLAPMTADRTFYQAIPGLLDALPEPLRQDVASARMQPAKAIITACKALLHSMPFDPARIRLALAPTIPLHCSDELIIAHRDLAQEYGVGLHMHLAESKVQAVAGITHYGKTLTAHLDSLGFLSPRFTAAHAVWLDRDDIQRLADNGVSIAHNPGSNMRLGAGVAPSRDMVEAGLTLGIGTDGANCSDNQNMFEAMRLASFVSRMRSFDYEDWLEADQVLTMATEGSAKALGLDREIGQLARGYKADIVFLDLNHVNYLPFNNPIYQLVNSEDGSAVNGVMIDGDIVLWQGLFTRIDLASVRAKLEVAQEELTVKNHDIKQVAEALEPHVGRFCIGLAQQPYPVRATVVRG